MPSSYVIQVNCAALRILAQTLCTASANNTDPILELTYTINGGL